MITIRVITIVVTEETSKVFLEGEELENIKEFELKLSKDDAPTIKYEQYL